MISKERPPNKIAEAQKAYPKGSVLLWTTSQAMATPKVIRKPY